MNLLIVNKENKLSKEYIPKNLTLVKTVIPGSVEVDRKIYLVDEVAQNWMKLKECVRENGYNIDISSGYRSYEYQEKLIEKFIQKKGLEETLKIAAMPGTNEHQTGLCLDYEKFYYENGRIMSNLNESDIEFKIVKNIAHKYGFILRYPKGKEDITGYKYEPWHLRYVGKEIAKEIYESDITLEEYKVKILVK